MNFIFTGSSDPAEVSGKNGTADLPNSLQVVEIGLKASSPVKTYLVDCMVKGPGPCYECSFNMIGPDGQSETWQMPNSDWRHLLFTVTPGDTEWYPLKLTARLSMTFKSCDVTEVP